MKDVWEAPALVKMARVPARDAPPSPFGDGVDGTTVTSASKPWSHHDREAFVPCSPCTLLDSSSSSMTEQAYCEFADSPL